MKVESEKCIERRVFTQCNAMEIYTCIMIFRRKAESLVGWEHGYELRCSDGMAARCDAPDDKKEEVPSHSRGARLHPMSLPTWWPTN